MLIKTTFSAVPINAEFTLGNEDFIKEDETKAKNLSNDGLLRFFEPDTEVYLVKEIRLKHLF